MALNTRLKAAAVAHGRPVTELRRQFLTQRFLARVFHADGTSGWVLTGGSGLLVRLPGARHSRDLDLLTDQPDASAAIAELREVTSGASRLDPFTFDVSAPSRIYGQTGGATTRVRAFHGVTPVGTFPVDVAERRSLVGHVDHAAPTPVITIDGVTPPPDFTLYPLADQIADKIAATYYRYGPNRSASTRFHDLVDLVLICDRSSFVASDLRAALTAEFRRRFMPEPQTIGLPGSRWPDGYKAAVRGCAVPPDAATIVGALHAVGQCLNPVLTGARTTGTWNPTTRTWE